MRSRDLRARLLALALATLVAVEAEAPPPPGDAFASRPGPEFQPELQLEACESVGAEKLVDWCRGELLLPGCFRVESVPDELPASCQLRCPNATGEAASLLGNGQSLVGGEIFLTGQLRLESLRLQLTGSLTLEDAQVLMSGNETTEEGGAFSAGSVVTIRRSNLTVAGTKAHKGGGFYAGDLVLFQSTVSIVGTAALAGSGGGFYTTGGVTMEQSSMWLQHTHAADDGGGFESRRAVRLINASLYILDSVAESSGGGFWCGALELTGSLMTVRGGRAGSRSFGGALNVVSIYGGSSHVSIVDSRVYIEECTAGDVAGGLAAGELRIAGSVLKVLNARAGRRSGGFEVGSLQVSSSVIELENTTADPGHAGAFNVWRRMVVGNHSKITLFRTFAVERVGGFNAEKGFEVVDGSMLSIHEAKTLGPCGAFSAFASVQIAGASTLRVSRSTAQAGDGGGLCHQTRAGEVLVTGRSQLAISDATSGGKGGGLRVFGSLRVTDQSVVHLRRCSAAGDGGGAHISGGVVVAHGSRFLVSDAMAGGDGGGLKSESVKIVEGSRLELQAVSAARGGGFYTYQFVVVAGSSTLTVSGSDAKLNGGAFVVERTLRVTKQSRLEAENSRAQESGGTFTAETVSASEGSEIVIWNGSAGQNGGCVWSQKLELSDSMLEASECVAHVDGGGFHADNVTLSRAQVRISGSALERGGGFFAQELEAWNSELWVAGLDSMAQPAKPGADAVLGSGAFVGGPLRLANSAVHLHNLRGKSAVASRCLLLSQSTLSLDAATEVGISVQNALCSCHATHVAGVDFPSLHLEGALVGMGVSSALLSVEPCGNETLEIAHVHFRTSHAAVAKTTAHTRLRNITVEYLEAIHEIQLLTAPSFEAETVQVSCPACAQGVTFASGTSGLRAVSPPSLHCEKTALLNGTTARCGCFFPQQVPDKHYGDDVEVSETGSYCMYCPSHSQARGEDCEKCPLHKAWSEGTGDPCVALPVQAELWLLLLLLAAVVFVLLAATAFEVLWAPLAVVDAHTLEGEGLLVTVQGPVCHLPKLLVNYIRSEVSYDFHGTGFSWLDSKKTTGKVKSLKRCKLQLPLQPEQPPYTCATSKGFLRVNSGYKKMLLQFWILLCLLLLVPTVLVVASLSKNGPWHVLVTEGYFVLPLVVCAALLHPVVAWLLRRQRTPLQEACREYLSELSSFSLATIPAAEDQDHPRNQGLSMHALQHFWEHFKRFVLERNMHFVVANIVEPLTEKRQTSFVSLVQGKPVSYFVSHSWATPFQHFVQCLQRHTAFTGALEPTYWICSFANNQWDIAKEIGTDVLDSAFAKVLQSGVQGVVMVLDQQVQPLTRVWCLFEFLLSSQLQLDVVFATDLGVLGDQGASPDIALQIGRKLRTLQVANCHASAEEDKQRIFQFIRCRMGSLANMDIQIRQQMSRILQHLELETCIPGSSHVACRCLGLAHALFAVYFI